MSNNTNKILWTATEFQLPHDLWKRLEDLGYKVFMTDADDGILEKIKNLTPGLWVGQINGTPESSLSAFEVIKSQFPELPVILMSNQPDVEEAVTAIKLGASEYVTGSVSSDQLWAILENALKCPCAPPAGKRSRLQGKKGQDQPIAEQNSMLKILELSKKIASARSTVLISGETGVGKEVIARYIHDNSDRCDSPFIAVNCAALPENLLESELFGHEKGSFTGAVSRKKGKFELADKGTLLLDEISETDTSIQAKLLRALQEREIDRVGGQASIPVDVRVIATTNRDLEEETKNGNFRLDLYYRLNVVPILIPPLRERPDDIGPLADHFLEKHCLLNNIPRKRISKDAEEFLRKNVWQGNVREFENLIERSTLLVDSDVISARDLELISVPGNPERQNLMEHDGILPLKEMEKKMIMRALNDSSGNRTHAANVLGISVRTLRNKLNEYKNGLEREGNKVPSPQAKRP